MPRRTPWWKHQQWCVKTVSILSVPGKYEKGDWVMIYCTTSKKEAQKLAKEWSGRMGQATTGEPGPGHRSRRDL